MLARIGNTPKRAKLPYRDVATSERRDKQLWKPV